MVLLLAGLFGIKWFVYQDHQRRYQQHLQNEHKRQAIANNIRARIWPLQQARASDQRVRQVLADLGPFEENPKFSSMLPVDYGLGFEDSTHQWRFVLLFDHKALSGHGWESLAPPRFSHPPSALFEQVHFWMIRINGVIWAALVILLFNWPKARDMLVLGVFGLAALHVSIALITPHPAKSFGFNGNILGFAIIILLTALVGLFFRPRRPTPYPACPQCRYNLTGNQSGVCPECGAPVPGAEAPRHAEDLMRMTTPPTRSASEH